MKKRTRIKMIAVPVQTIIEEPCLGRAFLGPEMTVWAFGYDDGGVEFEFLHPKDDLHPKLKTGELTKFEVEKGESPNVAQMWAQLGFSMEKKELLSFLKRVAVLFELSWEMEEVPISFYPPPPRDSSQPPALVN